MALPQDVEVLTHTLASLPMVVMITDCNGFVQWANACLSDLTGYAVDEMAGQNAGMLLSETTTQSLYEVLQDVVDTGKAWKGESLGRRKNGELYYFEWTSTPISGHANIVTHALWTLQDITEHKRSAVLTADEHRDMECFFTLVPELTCT